MGRLMDSILAAVGYKPSDRVQLTHEPDEKRDKPLPKEAMEKAASLSFPFSVGIPATQKPAPIVDKNPTNTNTSDNTKDILTDCTSCRIIGGSTLIATGIYTFYWANQLAATRKKGNQTIYRIQGATFAGVFIILGIARFGSFSVFDPAKKGYTAADHVQEEINAVFGFFNKETPEFLQIADNKSELPGNAQARK